MGATERAGRLVARMTFAEKVAVALGDVEAVAHLGIPPLRYADGPNGIRGPDNVTAFPASPALVATFDEGLAAAYGAAVASEARDTGSNVLLGPAVDIARVPLGGRLPEGRACWGSTGTARRPTASRS
jgi:beta-glucosidase